jgi:hypothetical protein
MFDGFNKLFINKYEIKWNKLLSKFILTVYVKINDKILINFKILSNIKIVYNSL